jgi:hypothetical protein
VKITFGLHFLFQNPPDPKISQSQISEFLAP